MNLLAETLDVLTRHGHKRSDVKYVTDGEHWCSWRAFAISTSDFEYDNGFGSQEVNDKLKVVGDDWWLERHEYDGSECWSYKTMPVRHGLGALKLGV